jgi:hypothetical protein
MPFFSKQMPLYRSMVMMTLVQQCAIETWQSLYHTASVATKSMMTYVARVTLADEIAPIYRFQSAVDCVLSR